MRHHIPSSTSPGSALLTLLSGRLFSTAAKLNNLPYSNRTRALAEARLALADYLHGTRSLPFFVADHIASNSPISLRSLVSQIPFDHAAPSDFRRVVHGFIAYHPINEFDFFFESIGLHPSHPSLPSGTPLFLSDDACLLSAVSALLHFGFRWTFIGVIYLDSPVVFSFPPGHLLRLLQRFEGLGFRRTCIIAICLTFPSIIRASGDDGENELLRDLQILFVDYDLAGCAGDDVNAFLRLCRRIRVFCDFGWEKGGMGELMGRNRRIFLEFDECILAQKLKFFEKLGMRMDEVGLFTLNNPGVLDIDLDNADIMIPDYLIRVGLSKGEADSLMKRYSYVMGKNKVGNLPGIIKALDLSKWFLTKIVQGAHFLSSSYTHFGSYNSSLETEFLQDIERIKLVKKHQFIGVKVYFFLSIGFGKNKLTSKAIGWVSGNREVLQERFDCLIELGIAHSMLCKMINATPKLLNQRKETLLEKVNYLCQDLGYPVEYLSNFPSFLCFDLENRIKPRYRILNWLRDTGLTRKKISPATVTAISDKKFIFMLSCIHPAAPKQWLEQFYSDKRKIKKSFKICSFGGN